MIARLCEQAQRRDVDHRRQHDGTAASKRCHQQTIEEPEFAVKHHRQAGIQSTAEGREDNHSGTKKTAIAHPSWQETLGGVGEECTEENQPDQGLQNPSDQG